MFCILSDEIQWHADINSIVQAVGLVWPCGHVVLPALYQFLVAPSGSRAGLQLFMLTMQTKN